MPRLTRPDGSPIPDDWTLVDDAGQPLGRIYAETGGPQGARWLWAAQVAPDGTPYNGGTGHAATGKEAREAVGGHFFELSKPLNECANASLMLPQKREHFYNDL